MSKLWFMLLMRDWGIRQNTHSVAEYERGLEIINGIPRKDLDRKTAILWLKERVGIKNDKTH